MKKQTLKKYIPLFIYIVGIIFLCLREFIIGGSIIISSGIIGIILKRYGAELTVLIGLFLISFIIHKTFFLIMAILITLVSCYDLIQIYIVNQEIKEGNKRLTNEEKLSAYREKELLHNLLKMIIKAK